MKHGLDLSDCRCVRCGAAALEQSPDDDGAETRAGAVRCATCGAGFDRVWGVPFLFDFDEQDFAGLSEIVANAHQLSPFTPQVLDHWHELLAAYHAAADKSAYLSSVDPNNAHWLPNRYNEWLQVEHLAAGRDWRGLKVLDVGAGLGFDAYRHVAAGAEVTAAEFSPVLAREGARNLPMIRWFGGASHTLPFADASFDAVFSNAALHHMRDIPAAIEEMLRVLRPGGVLITTGDAYRKDGAGEDVELAIFGSHTGVLSGINERVPRFCEFVGPLERHADKLDVRLFTQIVYDAWLLARRTTVEGIREWKFSRARRTLRNTSGSLALHVTLQKPIKAAAKLQKPGKTLSPATLAAWLDDRVGAMAQLAAWAPSSLVNARFPRATEKLDLLNGWRAAEDRAWGEAYLRGRWYLQRRPEESRLAFELRTTRPAVFELTLNGALVETRTVVADAWDAIDLDLSALSSDAPFAVEIRLTDSPEAFDQGLFWVRNRRLSAA